MVRSASITKTLPRSGALQNVLAFAENTSSKKNDAFNMRRQLHPDALMNTNRLARDLA